MRKEKMEIFKCKPGMLLAEDVICNGSKLVSKNTVLNSYIIDKLISLGEYSIYIFVLENNDYLNRYDNTRENFKTDYKLNINMIKKLINKLTSTNEVMQISESIVKYLDEPNVIIECLNSLKKSDEYTYTHCINVGIYSMLIAKWMNLSLDLIREAIQSGLLHDIGKIKIDLEILNKPGKLTNEEFYEIKKHTIWGYDLVNQNNNLSKNIKDAVLMHHERADGSGYPFGVNGTDITLIAKIVSVADTFDAMTSNRVYKKGTTPFKAFEMFMVEGVKQYDVSIIFSLLENIYPYYIGMNAMLEDGRIGEIVYISPNDLMNPIIKVNNELIDMSKENNLSIVNIFV
ncbi:HD-GYP domain-containing protein [Clostridium chromiireducens]|uniref:HD-GYP domain-containing protein n=1 Tax=Clostridium chromiireducens TaxID=225345 RepID=A0A399IVU7_9CLOT|nr:HD-GYP domain-containing protein [Clostridium chromiireducens]RII36349.1 HD-GYP domain-containing protein [Clostridium chromiireducens]